MANIFKNDVGTVLELTVRDENNAVVDLSSATLKQLKLYSPAGVASTKTASFTTNGTDGKLRYTTVTNDLPLEGDWLVRAYVEIGSSIKFHTSPVSFPVLGTY